jgi:allantoin racemase
MHAASFVATGFSIVTTLARTGVIARHLVETYGMTRFCRNIRAIDLPVLDLEDKPEEARNLILQECRKVFMEDHAGAIVLGCAGMAGLTADLTRVLGIPVIDGVGAAVKFIEALVSLGVGTSKVGDLAYPMAKPYTGALAHFAPRPRRGASTL